MEFRLSTVLRFLSVAGGMALHLTMFVAPSSAAWVRPDTKAIADAAIRLSKPGRFRLATGMCAASDGRVWLSTTDYGLEYVNGRPEYKYGGRAVTCQLVDRDGRKLGHDIAVSAAPQLEGAWSASPLASLPDGSLVVGCGFHPGFVRARLARIDTIGILAVSDFVPAFTMSWDGFIDRTGLLHIAGGGGVDYIQYNTIPHDMPIVKRLTYSDPFGTADSAPFCMRWKGERDGQVSAVAGCDEDSGRLVVASKAQSDTFIRMSRFDTRTLEVLDSGRVYLRHDVHHLIQDSAVWRLTLVPSSSAGFWLIWPGDLSPDRPKTAQVYHLSHDLSTLRPSIVGHDSVWPFAQAPEGSVLACRLMSSFSNERWSATSGWTLHVSLRPQFTACGPDGRLYVAHEERSAELTVSR